MLSRLPDQPYQAAVPVLISHMVGVDSCAESLTQQACPVVLAEAI